MFSSNAQWTQASELWHLNSHARGACRLSEIPHTPPGTVVVTDIHKVKWRHIRYLCCGSTQRTVWS